MKDRTSTITEVLRELRKQGRDDAEYEVKNAKRIYRIIYGKR